MNAWAFRCVWAVNSWPLDTPQQASSGMAARHQNDSSQQCAHCACFSVAALQRRPKNSFQRQKNAQGLDERLRLLLLCFALFPSFSFLLSLLLLLRSFVCRRFALRSRSRLLLRLLLLGLCPRRRRLPS